MSIPPPARHPPVARIPRLRRRVDGELLLVKEATEPPRVIIPLLTCTARRAGRAILFRQVPTTRLRISRSANSRGAMSIGISRTLLNQSLRRSVGFAGGMRMALLISDTKSYRPQSVLSELL